MIRPALLFAPLTALLLSACGSKGNCSTTNCAGCCDEQSYCQINFTASACGKGGAKCAACPTGNTCADGVCAAFAAGGGTGGTGGSGGGSGGGAMDAGRDGGADGGTGGGTGGGAGSSDGGATHFSTTVVQWSVPSSGLADGFNFPKVTLSVRIWDTFDIDGDGKPDLIHTADPVTGKIWLNVGTGQVFWKVFKNTGTGFATTPLVWAVPASGLLDGFLSTSSSIKYKQWATFDIDGDGKPDLVQTASPATDQVWAGPVWKVFKNTGTAFSATATNWVVPTPVAPDGGATLPDGYNAKDSLAVPRAWSTLDLDGDDKPDLVVTSSNGVVLTGPTGKPEWHIYKNLGTGFAATFTAWSVPASGLVDGFTMPSSFTSTRQWTTIDLDGDGLPDLVHTANVQSNAVFATNNMAFWRFYKNLGSSFAATPTQWAVPPNGLTDGFYSTELLVTSRRWTTRDINGDGLPDLIHTTNPASSQVWGADAGPTGGFWNVYRNNGSGFAAAPLIWSVPFSGLPEGFFSPVSNVSLNRWMSFDLDGDGSPDLVHTTNTATDTVWTGTGAQTIWKLYRAEL